MDEAYVALVQRLAATRDPEIISNSSDEHAAVLIAEMFASGKGCARVFSGAFNHHIYNQPKVYRAICNFLSVPGTSLKIIVQKEEEGRRNIENFFSELSESARDNVQYRVGDEAARDLKFHFATVGDDSFRFETDTENRLAFASFGRPDHVRTLTEAFENYWEHANEPVPA